jgi:ankyrin repeat protein
MSLRLMTNIACACMVPLLTVAGCGYTLLSAAGNGETGEVRALLDEGMDANMAFPLVGTHPLTLAAAGGHLETVCTLLDRGAQAGASDVTGWTALHAAAYRGHTDIVRLLVERGSPTTRSNWILPPPIVWAERENHSAVVAVLKEAETTARIPQSPAPCSQALPSPGTAPTP